MKRNIRHKKTTIRSQVCSTTIVASFTRHNINPAITLTPVLLLSKRRARVCIYDCEADILGYSVEVPYPAGIALIWLILHCRCYIYVVFHASIREGFILAVITASYYPP